MFTFWGYYSFENIIFLLLYAMVPSGRVQMFTFQIIQFNIRIRRWRLLLLCDQKLQSSKTLNRLVFLVLFLHGYFRSYRFKTTELEI